jgi:hypothetical protein
MMRIEVAAANGIGTARSVAAAYGELATGSPRLGISADTLAAKNGVSTLLRVRIDATLTLDRLALAGLVESVNGITVDLGLGSVTLDGVTAADYATKLRPGESEADRIDLCGGGRV